MTPEKRDYLRYRISRAGESLDVARWAFENNHLQDAVNRLYYGCFYVVSALLQTRGLSSARHSGVRSLFIQHWVKTGLVPRAMGRFYQDIFEHRQEGDYGDRATFTREDVSSWIQGADAFVQTISGIIEECIREAKADEDDRPGHEQEE